MIAGAPREPAGPPAIVIEYAAGRPIRSVWDNEVGGRTFQIGTGRTRRFLKWTPASSGVDLAAEVARLRWAAPFATVPRVLDAGADEDASWIVTEGLAGRSAVDEECLRDPARAVRAIGSGLRELHEKLPVDDCPFDWSASARLADARKRAAAGELDPASWHEDFAEVTSVDRALALLTDIPPVEAQVVCHGDACAPNTLVDEDWACCGHVDLGRLGVADRWADLAIATWSTRWNYGPGWEDTLLDAYGVAPDQERTRYYRLLWELAD